MIVKNILIIFVVVFSINSKASSDIFNCRAMFEAVNHLVKKTQRKFMDSKLKYYQTQFFTEFNTLKKYRVKTMVEVEDKILSSKVVLVSDHHLYKNSQRYTAYLIELMSLNPNRLNLVLEWIEYKDQKSLNQYLAGKISLSDFKIIIDFENTWGFDWKSYSSILVAAKKYNTRVLAVDSRKVVQDPRKRDELVAGRIQKDIIKNPDDNYLIVYGTYHILGKNHLRDRLTNKKIKVDMTILDEIGKNFFNSYEKEQGFDYLSFKNETYIINLGNPMEKLKIELSLYKSLNLL